MKRTYHHDEESTLVNAEDTTFNFLKAALSMEEKIELINEKAAEINLCGHSVGTYHKEMRKLVQFGNKLGIWDGFEYNRDDDNKVYEKKQNVQALVPTTLIVLGEHTERVVQKRRKQNPKENERDREEVREHQDLSVSSDTQGKEDFVKKHNQEKKKHHKGCVLL